MTDNWKHPLSHRPDDTEGLLSLRKTLRGLNYTPQGITELLGLRNSDELYPLDYRYLPLWLDRLESEPSPLSIVVRLLLLGLPMPESDLTKTLGRDNLELLANTGMVIREQGECHALMSIVPFEDLLIATDKLFMNADPGVSTPGLSADNAVWRLDKTTLIMSRALLKGSGNSVLELGCGSGVLSLLAAGNSTQVTGLDINPRAVNVAKFNAMLNGLNNVSFSVSNLYDKAAGQKYDLIFMNPPSAPGLVRAWNREGGPSGRETVEPAMKGAKDHLTEEGIFQTSFHAGYRSQEDLKIWAQEFFSEDEFGTVILLNIQEHKAEDFALNEAYQKAGPRDLELYRRTYQSYLGGLKAHGIERIGFAVLTAKRGGRGIGIEKADMSSLDWQAARA
jgi:methylase of polypeptide subunit release factors